MRLLSMLLVSVMMAGTVVHAAPKGQTKKMMKMCKEEMPTAGKKELKKCVREKSQAAKTQ